MLFSRLFEKAPDAKAMFELDHTSEEYENLLKWHSSTVLKKMETSIRKLEEGKTMNKLEELGVKHKGLGVTDEYYIIME